MTRRRTSAPAVRRKRIWAREHNTFTLAASTLTTADLLTDFKTAYGANAVLGATVARIRGFISVTQDGALGAVVDTALAILVDTSTAAPSPFTDFSTNWMYYHRWGNQVQFVDTGNAVTTSQPWPFYFDLDVKAMRKCEELGQTLMLCVEVGAGNPIDVTVDTSTLLLLP